jgi:hypothetical protein
MMIRTMLLTAALTAVAPPALAADIKQGDVCEKKVVSGSWHDCGQAARAGIFGFTNVSPHKVSVFVTYEDGPQEFPLAGKPLCEADQRRLWAVDAAQLSTHAPGEAGAKEMQPGWHLYVARCDEMLTNRTIGIQFHQVP